MEFLREDKNEGNETEVTAGVAQSAPVDTEILLSDYMKAGYSFLHVRTEEDYRAKKLIKKAYQTMLSLDGSIEYWEWSSTRGLLRFSNVEDLEPESEMMPIPDALGKMMKHDTAVVCSFYNIRQFLEMPVIVQKFKDAADECRVIGSHIILVGPRFDYPPELDKEITVWDLDLPTSEQFHKAYRNLATVYKDDLGDIDDSLLKSAAASAVGMTALQGENSIALSISKYGHIDTSLIQKEKEQIIKKSDVLEFVAYPRGMESLGGFDVFKEWISKRKEAYSEDAKAYGLIPPKGVLLVGVPGTGKSLAAKVLATELQVPLIRFDMGKVFRGLQGGSENAVRGALKMIEAVAPNVVWIDEIEKATAGVQSSGKTDGGTTARVMGTVLSWMQENTKPIFICATANNPSSLPAELLRKGRFSEIWGVPEPNSRSREEIWRIHINRVRPGLDVDYVKLVEASKNYVGAEIEAIIEEAMFDAYSKDRSELSTEHLLAAVENVIPQYETSKDNLDTLRSWMSERVRYVESKDQVTESNIFDKAQGGRKLTIQRKES